MKINSTVLDLW